MNLTKVTFVLFIGAYLFACSNLRGSQLSITDISYEEPNRMRFHGKGAGAGMMMMSSMGPMGIAIGVAIDEGIGKDIGKAATAAGFDLSSLLGEGLNSSHVKIDSVRVKRYGFITQRGENDPVAPQLHLDIRIAEKTINIQYPEAFPPEDIATWPLDQVKKNGELSKEAFTNAIQAIRSSIPNAQ